MKINWIREYIENYFKPGKLEQNVFGQIQNVKRIAEISLIYGTLVDNKSQIKFFISSEHLNDDDKDLILNKKSKNSLYSLKIKKLRLIQVNLIRYEPILELESIKYGSSLVNKEKNFSSFLFNEALQVSIREWIVNNSNSDSIILNHKDYPQLLNEIDHDYNANENSNNQELSQLFDTIINSEESTRKLISFNLTQDETEAAVKSEIIAEEIVSEGGSSSDKIIYYEEDKDVICILSDD
ncbi:hypothetical protein CONCODRAFT_84189 [Conidiobolus coronatus NRRL 28638]|uniref:Uncharacterized protein n=1 Tax=Conidiobolus coronatus (strain ATCC 28846 / CBS 209.66 / NRRL 28638) TaxID=796925 RepID=A0A137PB42_CONC2|nr:hypothetical protein CONCODRAFT_84189 [Conidiobolus coronatus NRRL 28638]|eukprot:KXN72240.1 hypothetical protein CONCODRAFT_84189 [Conidiobolus coronatus NRRL 28638]